MSTASKEKESSDNTHTTYLLSFSHPRGALYTGKAIYATPNSPHNPLSPPPIPNPQFPTHHTKQTQQYKLPKSHTNPPNHIPPTHTPKTMGLFSSNSKRYADPQRQAWVRKRPGQKSGSDSYVAPTAAGKSHSSHAKYGYDEKAKYRGGGGGGQRQRAPSAAPAYEEEEGDCYRRGYGEKDFQDDEQGQNDRFRDTYRRGPDARSSRMPARDDTASRSGRGREADFAPRMGREDADLGRGESRREEGRMPEFASRGGESVGGRREGGRMSERTGGERGAGFGRPEFESGRGRR